MPENMRERIAKVLAKADFAGADFDSWRDEAKEPLLARADAVLEAMREPTVDMGMAAFDATRDMGDEVSLAEEYTAVWQAMIDEARASPPPVSE